MAPQTPQRSERPGEAGALLDHHLPAEPRDGDQQRGDHGDRRDARDLRQHCERRAREAKTSRRITSRNPNDRQAFCREIVRSLTAATSFH